MQTLIPDLKLECRPISTVILLIRKENENVMQQFPADFLFLSTIFSSCRFLFVSFFPRDHQLLENSTFQRRKSGISKHSLPTFPRVRQLIIPFFSGKMTTSDNIMYKNSHGPARERVRSINAYVCTHVRVRKHSPPNPRKERMTVISCFFFYLFSVHLFSKFTFSLSLSFPSTFS